MLIEHWAGHWPQKSEKKRTWILGQILKSQSNHAWLSSAILGCSAAAAQNIFSLHTSCLILNKQGIDLKKVKTGNLKFRKDLPDWVMDDWSVSQKMIFLSGWLLKKIYRLKIEACSVIACFYMAFKPCFSFAFVLAANFGWGQFRFMPKIASKLLGAAICRGCAVHLESGQTPISWTGRWFWFAA